jgi:DNA-binding transcriptional ArsR family regulator
VLVLLRNLELTVSELTQVLGQTQPRMSQHLRLLQESGLVQRRKEGNAAFLSVGAACVQPRFALLDSWSEVAGPFPWFDADRALGAQRFFEKNSPRWGELRSLMVSDVEIQQAILAALDGHDVGRLLDIGTRAPRYRGAWDRSIARNAAVRARDAVG